MDNNADAGEYYPERAHVWQIIAMNISLKNGLVTFETFAFVKCRYQFDGFLGQYKRCITWEPLRKPRLSTLIRRCSCLLEVKVTWSHSHFISWPLSFSLTLTRCHESLRRIEIYKRDEQVPKSRDFAFPGERATHSLSDNRRPTYLRSLFPFFLYLSTRANTYLSRNSSASNLIKLICLTTIIETWFNCCCSKQKKNKNKLIMTRFLFAKNRL